MDPVALKKLTRKCNFHVVPPLFVLFLLASLDRTNIGNAKIQGLLRGLHSVRGTEQYPAEEDCSEHLALVDYVFLGDCDDGTGAYQGLWWDCWDEIVFHDYVDGFFWEITIPRSWGL
ncbi:hypothetical protein VC83_08072 [Pseudogymnoascus destructans]|uniref:Uncharacterized protein n=1 Tax=Pseudogymnoascus destructans TaxID=655981 RepID=A0A177A150_9PEZI|nr:uncharacterized protein VC83_08072 [Pseudogymnoascus destructans]OAF55878.1 hypothetical protein VC83_08072 [Pseudogymnoascus destructans]